MRTLTILAIAIAAAFSPLSQAQKPEVKGAVATAPGKAAAIATVSTTATVQAIDAATRTVHLKMADGTTRSVVAGDEVRNFAQIKVGDKVHMKYAEAMTLELKKEGKAVVGRTESTSIERAKPGEKPAALMKRETSAVVNVVNVDAAKKMVTVKTAKGELVDLPIQDPEQLKLIKKGDQVQATYTEALAVSLEPAAAAPAAAPKK
jgi:hypothetical protein